MYRYGLNVLETKMVMYIGPFGCKLGCEVIHTGNLQSVLLAYQYWVDKLIRITSLGHLNPTNEIRKACKRLAEKPPLNRKTFDMDLPLAYRIKSHL
jgi:hypothetical protein